MWYHLLYAFIYILFWVISGKCGFLWAWGGEALLFLFVSYVVSMFKKHWLKECGCVQRICTCQQRKKMDALSFISSILLFCKFDGMCNCIFNLYLSIDHSLAHWNWAICHRCILRKEFFNSSQLIPSLSSLFLPQSPEIIDFICYQTYAWTFL